MFTKEAIRQLWSSETLVHLDGTEYRVGRMSYGDYFLEPTSWQGGERDGHCPKTLWLKKEKKEYVLDTFLNNILLSR